MDVETFLRRVGRNIRTARHLQGLSLEAATTGRGGYRFLREVEQGRRNPSLQTLFQLARLFGVTVADLVNVAGGRPAELSLSEQKAAPPKRGPKPRSKRSTK